MSRRLDTAPVLAVACPYCEAQPGQRCCTPTGTPTGDFHYQRKGKIYPGFLKDSLGRPKTRGTR